MSKPITSCTHSALQHLFRYSLCPSRSLIARVASIAFPLIIVSYLIYVYSSKNEKMSSLAEWDIYSKAHDAAQQFAIQKLAERADIKDLNIPKADSDDLYQPFNPAIKRLYYLIEEVKQHLIEKFAASKLPNPWTGRDVFHFIDEWVKLSFSMGYLASTEIPSKKKWFKAKAASFHDSNEQIEPLSPKGERFLLQGSP